MSFASKVLYTGDGVVKSYNVPMPYISVTHLRVFIDEILQLNPLNYTLSGASTIQFVEAPGDGSAIEIKRSTSPTAILVDFVNGSVLNETDLDTAYLHNYYLTQEYADSFNEIINQALVNVATGAGIVETETDAVIAALVNEMLLDANAANLQARIVDIDANAEAIITLGEGLQVQINQLAGGQFGTALYYQAGEPVPGVGGVSDPIPNHSLWVDTDDGDKQYLYVSSTWTDLTDQRLFSADTYINALEAEYGANASSFINAVQVVADAGSATAQELSLLGVENGAQTAFVLDASTVFVDTDGGDTMAAKFTVVAANASSVSTHATAIGDIEAKYGVSLNVNGYVTGFAQINDGSSGAFVIVGDKFAIVTPEQAWLVATAYAVDDMIRPTVYNSRVYKCTTAGTSHATIEPTWPTTPLATVNDNGVVWEAYVDTPKSPFSITGDKITMNGDVEINGALMLNGSIIGSALFPGTIGTTQIGPDAITTTQLNTDAVTADKIEANSVTSGKINVTNLAAIKADLGDITAGTITMDTAGYIKGNKPSFASGTKGFWLGYDGGEYKFAIGNGTDFLTWDGAELIVKGSVIIGAWTASETIITDLAVVSTAEAAFGAESSFYKKVTMDRDGSARLRFSGHYADFEIDYSDSEDPDFWTTIPYVKIYKNGSLLSNRSLDGHFHATTAQAMNFVDVSFSAGDYFELSVTGGRFVDTSASSVNRDCTAHGGYLTVRADNTITGNTINTDA